MAQVIASFGEFDRTPNDRWVTPLIKARNGLEQAHVINIAKLGPKRNYTLASNMPSNRIRHNAHHKRRCPNCVERGHADNK